MEKTSTKILFISAILFLAGIYLSCSSKTIFSQEEQQWLAQRQTPITFSHLPHYAPFEFSDNNGNHIGMTADYLQILTEITGLTFESRGELYWADLMDAGKNKEIDIILQMSETPERRNDFLFTAPYIANNAVIILNKNINGAVNLTNLIGKKVLHPKGYAITLFLEQEYPQLQPTLVRDDLTALRMVSEGQADAALIDQTVASYLIKKHDIENLKIGGETGFAYISHLAVRNDLPILKSILDKALQQISPAKKKQINEKWISLANKEAGSPKLSNHSKGIYFIYAFFIVSIIVSLISSLVFKKQRKIFSRILTVLAVCISLFSGILFIYTYIQTQNTKLQLTQDELLYLESNRGELIISVETRFPPFEFIDDTGIYRGISADIIHLIEKKIGYSFHFNTNLSWPQTLEAAQSKTIDVISGIQKNGERSEYLTFTSPYLDIPTIIVVPEKDRDTRTLEDLTGKSVAIVDDYEIETYLRASYPDIILTEVPDSMTALRLVSFEEVDAAITPLATAAFLSNKEKIINLKVAGDSGYTYKIRLGVVKGKETLTAILSKAVQSITQDEKQKIMQKWLPLVFTSQDISKDNLLILSAAAFLISLIFLVVLFWNHSLIRSVELRTHELNTSLKDKRILIHEINHRLKNNLSVINSMLNIQRNNTVDKNIDKLLKQTQNRLESLSLVHEYLYESPQLHVIDFKEYSRNIVNNLINAHCHNREQPVVIFDYSTNDEHIDIVRITGLIIVEIVTNILKYAFPDGREGKIIVSWHHQELEKRRLLIEDNGIGFKQTGQKKSLGLTLVHELVKTTQGEIHIISRPGEGTTVEIILSAEAAKNRGNSFTLS